MKKPTHKIAARTMVMGFWRRNERGVGIVRKERANRGCQWTGGLQTAHQREDARDGAEMCQKARGWNGLGQ
jgi:hypothetical protein